MRKRIWLLLRRQLRLPTLARERAHSCSRKWHEQPMVVEAPAEAGEERYRSLRRRFQPRRLHLRLDEGGQLPCQLGTLETACAA